MNFDLLKNPLNWVTVFLVFSLASYVWAHIFGGFNNG